MVHDSASRTVSTSVESLAPHAGRLFRSCLEATDPLWDPEVGLLRNPKKEAPDVRASVRYAMGLLIRDEGDDRERAAATLDSVLDYQFVDEPEKVYYGTWARTPDQFHPMEDAVIWDDYDPNWREFIGSNLTLVHDALGDRIPDDLRERIGEANRIATLGTLERDVSPGYTNIALMRSFLVRWTADRFDDDEWAEAAESYADRVYDLFSRGETFCEFNSPTYTGVSLNALGYWLTSPRVERFRDRGAEMEAALWEQVGEFYHAGLETICGPYDRAYAMDTRRSITDYYVWLAAGGLDRIPFPESHHVGIPGNVGSALLAAVLGGWSAAPDGAVARFQSFQGEHRVERRIGCPDQGSKATAWLGEDAMFGGFEFEAGHTHGGDTLHVGTMHWRAGDGELGWGRVLEGRGRQPDVRADEGALSITAGVDDPVGVLLHAPSIDADAVGERRWELPGLAVDVDGDAAEANATQTRNDRVDVEYVPETGERLDLTLAIRTDG